jgi:hypothetical protein
MIIQKMKKVHQSVLKEGIARCEIPVPYFEVFFHLIGCAKRVICFDQARKDE